MGRGRRREKCGIFRLIGFSDDRMKTPLYVNRNCKYEIRATTGYKKIKCHINEHGSIFQKCFRFTIDFALGPCGISCDLNIAYSHSREVGKHLEIKNKIKSRIVYQVIYFLLIIEILFLLYIF